MATTIISDASVDSRTGVAAWAAWIKADGRDSHLVARSFKKAPGSTTAAELWALTNALHMAAALDMVAPGETVMLQSDCTPALGLILCFIPSAIESPHADSLRITRFSNPRVIRRAAKTYSAPIAIISDIIGRLNIRLLCRHVRGHTAGDGRQYVNRLVDKKARAAMRVARRSIHVSPQTAAGASET